MLLLLGFNFLFELFIADEFLVLGLADFLFLGFKF